MFKFSYDKMRIAILIKFAFGTLSGIASLSLDTGKRSTHLHFMIAGINQNNYQFEFSKYTTQIIFSETILQARRKIIG